MSSEQHLQCHNQLGTRYPPLFTSFQSVPTFIHLISVGTRRYQNSFVVPRERELAYIHLDRAKISRLATLAATFSVM